MVSAMLHLYSKEVPSYETQTHTFLLRSKWRLVNFWEIFNNPLVFILQVVILRERGLGS